MWDFLLGEAFVVCTARYSGPGGPGTGWPARFHVAPPWTINVDLGSDGRRQYSTGSIPIADGDMLHIPYKITSDSAHGTGPLDAGRSRLIAAGVLLRYLTNFVQGGAVPTGVLESEEEVSSKQASDLHAQWVNARIARLGLPAVLGGGVTWRAVQSDPLSTAMTALAGYTEAKISTLLGVPPFLLGLPSGGDSMTYSNVSSVYDFHWRGGLRPKAQRLLLALSGWLVPHGTGIEVNRDAYVSGHRQRCIPGPDDRPGGRALRRVGHC
jgi:phage portal protein BeeE